MPANELPRGSSTESRDAQALDPTPGHGRLQLVIALLGALVYHGGLLLFGTYRNTYDAFVHIFFADHWTRGWFDHWEPRWYTGFPMTSYPPLSQQSVAALSFVTDDLLLAFVIVQTGAMMALALGMYRFARIWVSDEGAGWAALWLVFSTAMAETVHVFGQLPTTFSLALLLNALPFAYAWVRRGRVFDLVRALALTAATTGAHHVTTLFGSVFIVAPVIVLALLENFRTPLPDESDVRPGAVTRANWRALVMRRVRRLLPPVIRAGIYTVGTVTLLLLVVLPYWLWSTSDPITQVPIPHASRDNFLVNRNAGLVFWLIPYGVLLFVFPYVIYKGLTTRVWPLVASIGLLALLGTGGTTPIPRLLLGGAFDILTLDRFTLWASILMLPLAGEMAASLRAGALALWLRTQLGDVTWRAVQVGLVVSLLLTSVMTVSLTRFRRFQPAPIATQPIVNFLEKDEHWRWRYMTLGFGDQMAWLSAQTTAVQVDGNYHSARRLPEMTTTPVERLEGAKFRGIPGIGSLQQFLQVPEKYNLKYIFSNDQFYDPLLFFYGWHQIGRLENGIVVWERADIPVLPEALPRREIPRYQRVMWGTLPPLALVTAVALVTVRFWGYPFRLAGEVTGLNRLRLPSTPVPRGRRRLDAWLYRVSMPPREEPGPPPVWQRWADHVAVRMRRLHPTRARARHLRVLLLLGALTVIMTSAALVIRARVTDPIRVVEAYYDDLDFRRFGDAYARLNPATRPTYDEYLLRLSVQGGLLASYAKLDTLETAIVHTEPDYLEVDVTARYITALSYYTDTATLQLVHAPESGWTIEPTAADLTVPLEQFMRRPVIDWLSQGRRRVTTETTDFGDVLDRPKLEVLSSRLVTRADGAFSVVGELANVDVDPADVTVTAFIYDDAGRELVRYNAGSAMLHKLLPLEMTPFRVDFEGVAGMALSDVHADLAFEPGARYDFVLPAGTRVGDYQVFAKAVVTPYDLARDLGAQDLALRVEDGRLALHGQLINNGLVEAVIPHVMVTLYDRAGNVLWVDEHFLPESIRPQRAGHFRMKITPFDQITSVLPAHPDARADFAQIKLAPPHPDLIAVPPGHGYAYLRVAVNYFTGSAD